MFHNSLSPNYFIESGIETTCRRPATGFWYAKMGSWPLRSVARKNGAHGVGYEVSQWRRRIMMMMMMMMMNMTRTTDKCVLTSMFCPQMMSTDVPTSH